QILEELQRKGKFYCNTRQYFQNLERDNKTRGQGDQLEQTYSIENTKNLRIEVTFSDGSKKIENWNQGKIVTNDIINFGHIYCFTEIKSMSDLKALDERLLSWGESCIIVSDPDSLIDRIKAELDKKKITCEARKVDYMNLNELGEIKMNPFIKHHDL